MEAKDSCGQTVWFGQMFLSTIKPVISNHSDMCLNWDHSDITGGLERFSKVLRSTAK